MVLAILSLLPLVLALPNGQPLRSRNGWGHNNGAQVAYFLDDNPDGSSIVSLKIGGDGLLSDPVRTSTHGFGIVGTSLIGVANARDPLGSQGSVDVSDNLLFTVNAGSNTVAMFRIPEEDPMHPQLVGMPANTLGEVPISVSYSDKLNTVCVLNGGAVAGVSCFEVDPFRGLSAAGPLRTLGNAINETTPPTGPPGSAAQIAFNPDSSAVFATIKGNAGTTPPTPGYIIGWPVERGFVSTKGVFNRIADIAMDFGFAFLSESRIFLSDPSYGASILTVSANLEVTEVVHTVVPSQMAICWAAYDPMGSAAYALDAGQPRAYKFNAGTGALEGYLSAPNATLGLYDAAVSNGKMYVLANAPGVVVFDLKQEKEVQFLNLSSLGDAAGYTGMALWPSYWNGPFNG